MDLPDIEIYLLGVAIPIRKQSPSASRGTITHGRSLAFLSLRRLPSSIRFVAAMAGRLPPISAPPRSWRCSSSPLPRHRRPGRRTTAITSPRTGTSLSPPTPRHQARHIFCMGYVCQNSLYFHGGRDASLAAARTLRHLPAPANTLGVPRMQGSFPLRRRRHVSHALPRG